MHRQERDPLVGAALMGVDGQRIGRVEAVFVDYLLVRTTSLLPIDLYVPRPDTTAEPERGLVRVECSGREAYERWHRPLRRAPHPD